MQYQTLTSDDLNTIATNYVKDLEAQHFYNTLLLVGMPEGDGRSRVVADTILLENKIDAVLRHIGVPDQGELDDAIVQDSDE